MAKKRRKKSKKQPTNPNSKKITNGATSKINKFLLWLSAIGLLPLIFSFVVNMAYGNAELTFIKPVKRGYEFQIENSSPIARTINTLRVIPDFSQPVVFKVTSSDFKARFTEQGVYIEGGNSSHMPAFQFKEIDNLSVPAKSAVNFRVPPLIAKQGLQPEAVIVYVKYNTSPSNIIWATLESFLSLLKVVNQNIELKYLVTENYWVPTSMDNPIQAMEVACRESEWYLKTDDCKKYR